MAGEGYLKHMNDYMRYDLIADYRTGSSLEHELKMEEEIQRFGGMNDYMRYDLIADYRTGSSLEHELKMEEEIQRFEKERHKAGATRRRIFPQCSRLAMTLAFVRAY
ncbi:hypothetical protein COOONC_11934 [Cooperia oncophora]